MGRGSEHPDLVPCDHPNAKAGSHYKLKRHISFVDCPGHDILMATMLNGAAVMDAALLLVAGNEPCPQPQTSEHLAAVEIMRLKHIIILQNKVELIKENQAQQQYEEIKKFVAGTAADSAPIIPICAGGSILEGVLKLNDEIEIRPGVHTKDSKGEVVCKPIRSRIVSMHAENNSLQYAVPGGLIGVGTMIDPTQTRSDKLVGQICGHPNKLPEVFITIEVKYHLLRRLLGVKTDGDSKAGKVAKLKKKEVLMVNIGSTAAGGIIESIKEGDDVAKIKLTNPVCTQENDKVALSRRIEKHWRLIGWGTIERGFAANVAEAKGSSK